MSKLGEAWKKFREFDNKGFLVDHVKGSLAYTKKGYVIDRRVFQTYILIIIGLLVYVGYTSGVGWTEFYIGCPKDSFMACKNPYYQSCDREECQSIVNTEYLAQGFSIGRPPSEKFQNQVRIVWMVAFLLLIVAFLTNHLIHNQGRSFKDILPELEVEE